MSQTRRAKSPKSSSHIQEAKHNFFGTLDFTRQQIHETRSQQLSELKVLSACVEKAVDDGNVKIKNLAKTNAKLARNDGLFSNLLREANKVNIPIEDNACEVLLKRRSEIERETSISIGLAKS